MAIPISRSRPPPPIVMMARQEELRLVAELRQIPAYRRLRAVQTLLRAYMEEGGAHDRVVTLPPSSDSVTAEAEGTADVRAPREGSRAAEVVRASREYLRSIGRRAQAPELADEMARRGIVIDHPRPSSIVASYLSTSPYFDNERPAGYGLVEWKNAQDGSNEHDPEPDTAAAPATQTADAEEAPAV